LDPSPQEANRTPAVEIVVMNVVEMLVPVDGVFVPLVENQHHVRTIETHGSLLAEFDLVLDSLPFLLLLLL
jgi:hypothetical protein